MSDALAEKTDDGLAVFAEAVFGRGSSWMHELRALTARPEWPARREKLLAEAEVDACARMLPPEQRCVIEAQLGSLGQGASAETIARLLRIARQHPQRELRIHALHGLALAGSVGLDAAAGHPGEPPHDEDVVVQRILARFAIDRGDAPELVWRGDAARKHAVLATLVSIHSEARRTKTPVAADPRWLPILLDAYFDRALAATARAVLEYLPAASWKPAVAARKSAAKTPLPKKPTAKERSSLDAELEAMRVALEEIVRELRAAKYAFVVETPLARRPRAITAKLKKLEKRVGSVPLALARFWAIVGDVDLRGNHPAWQRKTWVARGDEPHWYADPLVVTSLASALADAEDASFDVAEAPPSLRYALDIAGDEVTKANFSGGIVSIETPSDAIDPPLVGRRGTFLELLRESIAAGGFAGVSATDRSRRP